MKRTSKTIIGIIVSALLVIAASLCFAQGSSPKFERYDPATFKGKTGSISLPMAGQSMLLLRRWANNQLGDYMQVSGKEKSIAVPVGTYKVQYCFVTLPGKDGTTWAINANAIGEKDKPIQIKAGKSTTLAIIQQVAAATKSAKTGTITLPYAGQGTVVLMPSPSTKSSSSLQATCESNKLTVPVGSYIIAQYGSAVTDKDGAPWSFACTPSSDQGTKVYEIKEGENIKLDSSEPLTASIQAKQDGDKLNLTLALTGADGRSCTVRRSDGKGEAPGFQVLSESGEVLMSGKFAYG